MNGATPATLGTSTANSLGSISITLTEPPAIGGVYTAALNGDRGSAGSRTFTIAPSIAISASSAAPGSRMTISIRGFPIERVLHRLAQGRLRLNRDLWITGNDGHRKLQLHRRGPSRGLRGGRDDRSDRRERHVGLDPIHGAGAPKR